MLRATHVFGSHEALVDRVMDSNDQERERGITILAKAASVQWGDVRINLVDTPGHADFGGEVERALALVDGVLLLVDAAEGPLPQTRYVLSKALAAGLPAVVVLNKVDRQDARADEVLDEIYQLFLDLDAADERIEFPIISAVAREGRAMAGVGMPGPDADLTPLFEAIVDTLPAPDGDPDAPLQAIVTNLDASEYLGRLAARPGHPGHPAQGRPGGPVRGGRGPDPAAAQAGHPHGLRGHLPRRRRRARRRRPVRHRRVPRGRDRRHHRRPGRPQAAAPPRGRRAGAAHDLRRQHLAAGRQGGHLPHLAPPARAPRPRGAGQRVDPPGRDRRRPTSSRWPAAASCSCRCSSSRCAARATSCRSAGPRSSCARSTASATSRSSGPSSTCPTSTWAPSPRRWRRARARSPTCARATPGAPSSASRPPAGASSGSARCCSPPPAARR